ncbi:stalk domain-containing protein [Paenibacillus pasadenensis]|uniref:ABC-type Fe3+-siderophore transport system, periplasmic iron-binding component n=1 Tax=Paenibacillus pasadenensis TaxID=217090 RepID=A0A2N5N8B3_9BACL|nr:MULTISPECIES: stalk domain-containing protein [Paenibacillus]PLT46574.1 ABC-type Fe3+-siderophore transport system, periplasmic iron-binding component [Paenibacillus pasadenensis]QGG56969.1 ABC transporter substrate-binding protein [Paenibacillus sp. B01]
MIKLRFRSIALALSLFVAAVSIPATGTAAAAPIQVKVDGSTLRFDVPPQIINGTTMVPYSAIVSKIGAKLSLDSQTKTLKVSRGAKSVQLKLGSSQAAVDGKTVTLGAKVVEKDGRTLVPLRFLGEAFGLWVNWNGSSKTASIETKRTIQHAMGETTLTSVPKRVVVLFNGMVDISLTLGVKPVGAVESWVQQPWYHYLRSDMSGVKSLGTELQPNLEAIVALKPDLIIGAKTRHEKIYGQLSKIAPTVFADQLFEWKSNMEFVSKALNKESVYDAFMSDWNKKVATFKAKVGSASKNEVSIVRFYDDNSARIYNTGFAGDILKELGLSRPKVQTESGKVFLDVASQEQIPLMDGDIIFDITSSNHGGEEFKTQEEWQKNALWTNLRAVKNNKYYKVNDITWNMSGGATAAKMMLDDLYFYYDI